MNATFRYLKLILAACSIAMIALLSGCGGGGSDSGGSSGDWYYHFICNGDNGCLSTNFASSTSGTSDLGPGAGGQSGCNSLMFFGNKNWYVPPAQQWCDNSPNLNIPPATLISITVTPAYKSLPLGLTQQYTATGHYSDGTSKDITSQVNWSANCGGVLCTPSPPASINASGLATALATGSITIYASTGSLTGSATLTVTAASLQSITVTPANPTVNQYLTQQFTATGHYSDGTSHVLSASWASDTLTTATIDSSGLATAVAAGTSTITATSGAISGSTLMTVSPAVLVSIAVTPTNPSLANGYTLQLTAMGTYSNAAVVDITAQVTWGSADTGVAPISSGGLVTGSNTGTSLMSASLASVTGSTTVTVTPAVLQSIAVTPASPSVETGLTIQMTATGIYSDNSTNDITTQVTWTSGTLANATIDSNGLATGVAAGTSLIGASLNSISGSTTLTVIQLGSSWAPVTTGSGGGSGTSNALNGVTWTGTQFVTVGAAGTIMTSPDGITWTTQASGTSANLNAVIWTGTQLVAVGASGTILTSLDGVTWTSATSGVSFALNAAIWTGSQMVAVGDSITSLTSPDGITWTPITPAYASYGYAISITWNGTYYFVGANSVSNYVDYPDSYYTADFQTWNFLPALGNVFNYGFLWTGAQFIAVQSGGGIKTSPDGYAWTSQSSGSSAALRAVAWSSAPSLYVVVGDTGTVLTSPDSAVWTSRTSGTSSILRGVAWSGTHIVTVGDAGTIILTSP